MREFSKELAATLGWGFSNIGLREQWEGVQASLSLIQGQGPLRPLPR